jgi:hypothetical protein
VQQRLIGHDLADLTGKHANPVIEGEITLSCALDRLQVNMLHGNCCHQHPVKGYDDHVEHDSDHDQRQDNLGGGQPSDRSPEKCKPFLA